MSSPQKVVKKEQFVISTAEKQFTVPATEEEVCFPKTRGETGDLDVYFRPEGKNEKQGGRCYHVHLPACLKPMPDDLDALLSDASITVKDSKGTRYTIVTSEPEKTIVSSNQLTKK